MLCNCYSYAAEKMAEQEVLNTDAQVSLNLGSVHNEPYMTAVFMTQISNNACLNKWGKKGRGAVNSYMKQIRMRYMFIPLHRKYLTKAAIA